MEDNSDIQPHAKVMADGKMNIYVAYVPTADFKSYEYYYASFCANCDCPKPVPEPRTKPKSEAQEAYNHYNTERKYNLAPKLPNGTSACAIEGVPLGKMAADAMKYYRSIRNKDVAINWGDLPGMSVDPQTGDILLVTRVGTALDRNGTWGGFSQQPITNVQFFLAPAGQDRYHALALGTLKSPVTVNSKSAGLTNMETPIAVDYAHPLYYLAYSNGKWSAPIKIGSHDLFSKGQNPFVPPKNELTEAIASDDHGHALLIWPTRDAIVGRWITLN